MRLADERLIPIWEKVQHQQRLTRDDGLLLPPRGRDFCGADAPVLEQDGVGERPADVDPEHDHVPYSAPPRAAGNRHAALARGAKCRYGKALPMTANSSRAQRMNTMPAMIPTARTDVASNLNRISETIIQMIPPIRGTHHHLRSLAGIA